MKNLKRFIVPLQALFALGACSGMAWMLFVIASFDPNPPTSADLQARSTDDLSFASMNSTAAALAFDMIGQMIPSPIILPVTGRDTPFPPALTIAVTLKPIVTSLGTSTPSSGQATSIPPTATREDRERPTRTSTPAPTITQPPPTRTRTPTPTRTTAPSATVVPSNTPTFTPVPPMPTDTDIPITETPIPTTTVPDTPIPVDTPTSEMETPTPDSEDEEQPVSPTPS